MIAKETNRESKGKSSPTRKSGREKKRTQKRSLIKDLRDDMNEVKVMCSKNLYNFELSDLLFFQNRSSQKVSGFH